MMAKRKPRADTTVDEIRRWVAQGNSQKPANVRVLLDEIDGLRETLNRYKTKNDEIKDLKLKLAAARAENKKPAEDLDVLLRAYSVATATPIEPMDRNAGREGMNYGPSNVGG